VSAAVYALVANSCVAALFVVTYGLLALSYSRQRAAIWFMVSYLLGFLTPFSQLLIHFTDHVLLFSLIGYGSFLGSILVMAVGIRVFSGSPPHTRLMLLLWMAGMALRLATMHGTRCTLPYEIAFQLPFAGASALALVAARRIRQHGLIRALISGVFVVIFAHFLIKPFMAVALGTGTTAKAYAGSLYAIASQISTGVLLVAAGLFLMLLVIQKALEETILDAETDPLTGLTNRRGLYRMGPTMLAEAKRDGHALYALVLDLDHFKRINDRHGHAMGDLVLVAFADVLHRLATPDALAVRMGGEEFTLLLPDRGGTDHPLDNRAVRLSRAIRSALESFADRNLPVVTVSGGIARQEPGETIDSLIARADQLAYRAKRLGRNRILNDRIDMPAPEVVLRPVPVETGGDQRARARG
jgi:diguanylate cyclase (GGDEF)-like protein